MSTAVNAPHIRREPVLLRQSVVTTCGSSGHGWLFQEITKQLPGRGLNHLDLTTLTKLLREAERVMANTNLLLESVTDPAGAAATSSCVRTARRPKRHPKTATSA
jgi:hypothetical protein